MWFRGASIIVLFTLKLQWHALSAEPLSKAARFNEYGDVLRDLSNFGHKLRIVEAVWGEIRADYVKDMSKTAELYRQVSQLIDNAERVSANHMEAAEQLRHSLHQHLVQLYGEQLTSILIGQQYPAGKSLEYICDHLLSHHDTQLTVPIFAAAINAMYSLRSPTDLAASLQFVGKQCGWSAPAFEAVLETQLHLYRTFQARGDYNDRYLFNAAYYLLQLQKHQRYGEQRDSLKHRHTAVVRSLPSSLQFLFFRSEGFCLLNRAYDEFFYTTDAIPIDEKSHHVFNWVERSSVGPHGIWLPHINELGQAPAELKLQFELQSNLTKNYLYVAPRLLQFENIVASWLGGNPRSGGEWYIQLLDGHLVLSRPDGYIMCASEQLYSVDRRYVYVYRDQKHRATSSECQWMGKQCN